MNFSLPESKDPVNNKVLYNFIYGYVVLIVLDIGYRIGNGCIKININKINKLGWDIFSIGNGIALGVGIGIVWWILIKSFTEPYYHKYLLLGSNTIVSVILVMVYFNVKILDKYLIHRSILKIYLIKKKNHKHTTKIEL